MLKPRISRYSLVGSFAAALWVAGSSLAAPRLNVLMIAVDDLRPQLGCYGDTLVKSPNIDRLAARGLVFERAYCQEALCSPSRISLLSGRRPSTSKIYQIGPTLRSQMPDITTLPQHFKSNGYFTRSLGKVYHVGIDDPPSWSVPSWQSKKPRYGPDGVKRVEQRREDYAKKGTKPPAKGEGGLFAHWDGHSWRRLVTNMEGMLSSVLVVSADEEIGRASCRERV